MTWPAAPTSGEAARTAGHSSAMASASAAVRVGTTASPHAAALLAAGKDDDDVGAEAWNWPCTR